MKLVYIKTKKYPSKMCEYTPVETVKEQTKSLIGYGRGKKRKSMKKKESS